MSAAGLTPVAITGNAQLSAENIRILKLTGNVTTPGQITFRNGPLVGSPAKFVLDVPATGFLNVDFDLHGIRFANGCYVSLTSAVVANFYAYYA